MPEHIRDLDEDDVDALQALLETLPDFAQRVTGYPPGPADGLSALVSVPRDFDPADKHGIGFWNDGALAAFADLLLGYPDLGTAHIGLLVVHRDFQNCGLGRHLHDSVIDRALSRPAIQRMRLGIVQTNAAFAEPFWRALGYRPTGESKDYRYDKLHSSVSIWELPLRSRQAR